MTSHEMIFEVLKRIKDSFDISPWPNHTNFKFNDSVVGMGILTIEEERKILLKLEKEGAFEIYVPVDDAADRAYVEEHSVQELVFMLNEVSIKRKPKFDQVYKKYKPLFKIEGDFWKLSNPLWWLTSVVRAVSKHKLLSILLTLLTLVAIDYGLAWKNIGWVFDRFVGK